MGTGGLICWSRMQHQFLQLFGPSLLHVPLVRLGVEVLFA